jgi:phosphate transport system substrate-binding protein
MKARSAYLAFFYLLTTCLSVATPAKAQTLEGAGSTTPSLLFQRWFQSYKKLHPTVKLGYKAVGSSNGLQRLSSHEVDFAVVNAPLTQTQLDSLQKQLGCDLLQIPLVVGAVVPIYKVDGVNTDLRFTAQALAGIFMGTITRWDDPEIAIANPRVALPDEKIVVVHRTDPTDSTWVWTNYLSQISPAWKNGPGVGLTIKWPVGLGVKGDDGVEDLVVGPTGSIGIVDLVRGVANSIGYVQLHYAVENKLPFGDVENSKGFFVRATDETLKAAAEMGSVLGSSGLSGGQASDRPAYPITSYTWLLVPVDMKAKKSAGSDLFRWMLTDGQSLVEPLHYTRIPSDVAAKALSEIERIH